MQQENADVLTGVDSEDDSTEVSQIMEKLTKLAYYQQMDNYLSYGRWDLDQEDIERIRKDEEAKQRVSRLRTVGRVHNCFSRRLAKSGFSYANGGSLSICGTWVAFFPRPLQSPRKSGRRSVECQIWGKTSSGPVLFP